MTVVLTRRARTYLATLAERQHGDLYDTLYAYPARWVRQMEAEGLVRTEPYRLSVRWVEITDAGRALVGEGGEG